MEFRLYEKEVGALVEAVEQLKYLGRTLHQADENWPEIFQYVKWERKVWGRLSEMLQREGADIKSLRIFYRAVAQVALLFVSDLWVLLVEM